METQKKQKNPKFRVVPNLSLKGPEIMRRLKNRSLNLEHGGQYSIDEEIQASLKLDKVELKNKARENAQKIADLAKKLDK